MSTLLVIGGSGFFGKSIIDAYMRGLLKPWRVERLIAMSRHATDLVSTFPEHKAYNIEFINADIATETEIPQADYVIHAAASTDLRDYLSKPVSEKNNIQAGTYNYCKLAQLFHQHSKIVYTSSGAVYGVQPETVEQMSEEDFALDIELMDAGKKDYAIAKQDAEKAIIDLGKLGIKVSIARCYAFVGKWLPRNQHFAIGNFIKNGLEGNSIVVKAKHQVYRSYMYADDLVIWLMTIAENASTTCPIFNVGSDEAISIHDLGKLVADYFNVNAQLEPIIDTKVDRYIPSISKASNTLGLKLNFNVSSALHETVLQILPKQH